MQLPADLRRFNCRNNRLAELALRQDGFLRAVRRRRAAAAERGSASSSARAPPASFKPNWRTANAILLTGALPANFDYARNPQLVLGGRFPAPQAGFGRPRRDRILCMRLERQGLRLGAADDRGGPHRRRRRRRGRLLVLDHPLRLSLAATLLERRRAVRSTLPATAFRSAKPPPLRCSNASRTVRRRGCAAIGRWRIERCLSYDRAASGRPWSAQRDAGGIVERRPRGRRDRLHQLARHRHAEQRSLREPGRHQPVWPDHSLQFDQGRDRPYARRGRRIGSGDQRIGPAECA